MDKNLQDILNMVNDEPNDMKLGKLIRHYVHNLSEENLVKEFNRNRHPDDWAQDYQDMQKRIIEMYR